MRRLAGGLCLLLPSLAGCGYDAQRTDGGAARLDTGGAADAACCDAPASADAPVADAPIASGDDAPAVVTPDVGPPPVDAPPLPVSCDATGPMDCSPLPDTGGRCPDGPSTFGRSVNAAIDATIAEHPDWFDTVSYPASTPLIFPAHVNDYMQAVTDHLAAAGLCASGPGEELAVKRNGDCSESWDIVANPDAATNLVRRHYVGNCFPAWF